MIRVHPAPGMPSEPQTDEDKAQLPGPELYLKHYKQVGGGPCNLNHGQPGSGGRDSLTALALLMSSELNRG